MLSSATTWTATPHSLVTAFGGTALAVLIGGIVALLVSLTDIRRRNAFVFCFVMPLLIAPQVVALAWLQMFGPSSPLLKLLGIAPAMGSRNPLYSPGRHHSRARRAVRAARVPHAARRACATLPQELIEAGLSGGAGPLTVVRTIVLPLMTPPLLAGVALCFVSCLGNFGIPALLGIPGNYLVLPTLIYQRLSGLGPGALSEVAVLSVLIGAIAVIGIVAQDHASASARLSHQRGDDRRASVRIAALALARRDRPVDLVVRRAPAAAARARADLARSRGRRAARFRHGDARQLSFRPAPSRGGPARVSSTASACRRPRRSRSCCSRYRSRISSSGAARRLLRVVNLVTEVPYAVPGVVLAIAAILLFLKPLPLIGVSIYNTIWIILFCYLARFLVLGLRPVISGYHQLDRTLEEASQIAGARLLRRLRTIIVPLVAPAAAAGALLIFLTAFNELTVSALLWSSGSETLGVVFFSFQQGGDSTYAAALGVLTVMRERRADALDTAAGRPAAPAACFHGAIDDRAHQQAVRRVPRARRRFACRQRR